MFKRLMFGVNRIRYNLDTRFLIKDLFKKAINQIDEPQTNLKHLRHIEKIYNIAMEMQLMPLFAPDEEVIQLQDDNDARWDNIEYIIKNKLV